MRITGLLVNLLGFAIAVSGPLITKSHAIDALIAVVGICVSLLGILGILNKYYLAHAIWKQ
jgi:hypothetical protein